MNIKDVRKFKNSLEVNDFIEKYVVEGNSSNESVDSTYWNLFEEWKKTLKTKPGKGIWRARTLVIDNERIELTSGQECSIPKGIPHSGEFSEGTRTIHVFGGKRAVRKNEMPWLIAQQLLRGNSSARDLAIFFQLCSFAQEWVLTARQG